MRLVGYSFSVQDGALSLRFAGVEQHEALAGAMEKASSLALVEVPLTPAESRHREGLAMLASLKADQEAARREAEDARHHLAAVLLSLDAKPEEIEAKERAVRSLED